MMTLGAYRVALAKIANEPLTLTEEDFAVLESFNPADELRGREAVRKKQLAIVETKAIAAPHEPRPTVANAVHEIVKVLHHIKGRLDAIETQETGLTARIAAFEQLLRETRGVVQGLEHTPTDDEIEHPEYLS